MEFIIFIFRMLRGTVRRITGGVDFLLSLAKLKLNRVTYGRGLKIRGRLIVDVPRTASFVMGDHVRMNNGLRYNQIGRQQPCFFILKNEGKLTIGNNVGMSSTAIVCWNSVTIGDSVKIGGNTVIYDTDFHSLNLRERCQIPESFSNVKTKPVVIGDNAFIGAHSTILKGVEIGEAAIVGAGSVVSKDVPAGEIWAGNPARFVKKAPQTNTENIEIHSQ